MATAATRAEVAFKPFRVFSDRFTPPEGPILTWLAALCERTFVPEYSFTLTEHDAERPWIVRGQDHHTVALGADVNFFDWAAERWPAPKVDGRACAVAARSAMAALGAAVRRLLVSSSG